MKFEDAVRRSFEAQTELVNALSQVVAAQTKKIDALTAHAETSNGVTDALSTHIEAVSVSLQESNHAFKQFMEAAAESSEAQSSMIQTLHALINGVCATHDQQINEINERLLAIEGIVKLSLEHQ